MRVLHVIPFIALRHGGSTHALRKLTKASLRFCESVSVLTGEGLSSGSECDGFEDDVSIYSRPGPIRRLERVSPGTLEFLRRAESEYDLIHVHNQFNFTSTAASWVSRATKVPVIVRPLGTLDPWCFNHKAWKKRPFYSLFIKRALGWSAAIHVTSEHERRSIEALGFGEKAVVLPLSVEVPEGGENWASIEDGADVSLRPILFLSRWDEVKNIPNLLKAFKILVTRKPGVRLVLAGSGPEPLVREVHRLIDREGLGPHIDIPGFVTGADKEKLFSGASMFVLPSFQENFGIAAAEAMARGVPVVTSEGLGLSDLAESYDAAQLFDPKDSLKLADAMETVLLKRRSQELSDNGKQLFEKELSFEAMTLGLESLYRGVLSQ